MLQKQISLMLACAVSLFVLSGCGKQKTKPTKKATRTVKTSETKKNSSKTGNMVDNPSFEKAKIFDKGLYKKGKYSKEKPAGWTTGGQVLDDFSGWAFDEAHSGKRSLKIENIGGTNAYWSGKPIIIKEPFNAFKVSFWTKAKGIKKAVKNGQFKLELVVYLKHNNRIISRNIAINIPKINHDWKEIKEKYLFEEKIVKIVPYLYFSAMTGSVYFDDISINFVNINLKNDKILFNSNDKKSKFNISPFVAPIDPRNLSHDLSPEAKALALEGPTIYQVKGHKKIISSGFIPVEENKIYKLSGTFKVLNKANSILHFGYQPYSENRKLIKISPSYILYNAAYNRNLKSKWTNYSNFLASHGSDFVIPKLCAGTKYIKIIILANWGTPQATLQFKDIVFEENF